MNIDKLPKHSDDRGDLVPVEFSQLPFIPKRMFYVQDVPAYTVRGQHGHFKCKQYYICMKGIIEVTTWNGIEEKKTLLSAGQALFINNTIWSSEKFWTGKDVLLVMCSEAYEKNDYFVHKWISSLLNPKIIESFHKAILKLTIR